jgi:hypothetical protein
VTDETTAVEKHRIPACNFPAMVYKIESQRRLRGFAGASAHIKEDGRYPLEPAAAECSSGTS